MGIFLFWQMKNYKFGKRLHPYHDIWAAMIARCYSKKHKKYHRYGARGITVCDRWKNSLYDFANDMGDKPTKKHSIDIINNNGNYEPTNCRWATNKEQCNNVNHNVFIDFRGSKIPIKAFAKKCSVTQQAISYHIKRGRSPEYIYNHFIGGYTTISPHFLTT